MAKYIEDATPEEYFTNKKSGWIKSENNPGSLVKSLRELSAAFKKLAEADRTRMMETTSRLINGLEKRNSK